MGGSRGPYYGRLPGPIQAGQMAGIEIIVEDSPVGLYGLASKTCDFDKADKATDISSASTAAWDEAAEDWVRPEQVPQKAVKLPEQARNASHVTMCFCLTGRPDQELLRQAFQAVVNNNPAMAGRVRTCADGRGGTTGGLEIGFDGHLGCLFGVREICHLQESELLRLDSSRLVRRIHKVHCQLKHQLGVETVGPMEELVGKDRPLCCATLCLGAQVSIVTLSLSRALGDIATLFKLVQCWDQEYASPGSSSPLSMMDGTASRLSVLSNLVEAAHIVLQAPLTALKAMEWARRWLWGLTMKNVGCCTHREVDGTFRSSLQHVRRPPVLSAAATLKMLRGVSHASSCEVREENEFHVVAVRLRQDTLTAIRLAGATSALPGYRSSTEAAHSEVQVSDALSAWLGNVLRSHQLVLHLRGRGAGGSLPVTGHCPPEVYEPTGGVGRCHALEIRRMLNGELLRQTSEFGNGLERTIIDMWMEAQYVPSFGHQTYLTFPLFDLSLRLPRHCILRTGVREFVMCHFVWRRSQVLALQCAWRNLGETTLSVTSEAEMHDGLCE